MDKPYVQLSDHPPPLSEPYQKARRSYVLASALLIAWELIGFEVSEVPLENVKIAVKSPQAIPAVLIVLIGYFALRVVQEWFQCDARRRKDRWALSDFVSANTIALIAISVYITQRIVERQLADIVTPSDIIFIGAWYLTGYVVLLVYFRWKEFTPYQRAFLVGCIAGLISTPFLWRKVGRITTDLSTTMLVLGAGILFICGSIHNCLIRWWAVRRSAKRGTTGSQKDQ